MAKHLALLSADGVAGGSETNATTSARVPRAALLQELRDIIVPTLIRRAL